MICGKHALVVVGLRGIRLFTLLYSGLEHGITLSGFCSRAQQPFEKVAS